MPRIVITTAGTTGDLVPFLSLGKRLQQRGNQVVMAVNPAMSPAVERAGLAFVPCGRPFGAADARDQASSFEEDGASDSDALLASLQRLGLAQVFRDLRDASQSADLLISSSLQGVAPWIHEATGIPWINATIFAAEFPHSDEPPPPQAEAEKAHWRVMFDHRNAIRAEVGLRSLDDAEWKDAYWSKRCVLVASSSHFSQPRLIDRPPAQLTGFWFDDDEAERWTPDDDLARYLDAGPPPLVLTLSSLPVQDPARVVSLHAEAAGLLGKRLIIQRGWAGLDRSGLALSTTARPEDILFIGHAPHAWLLPRCDAVIHHGGIGTTAQALRRGRPMLVEPYCNDQFFNGSRVAALGVGVAVDHRLLTPANLADAIDGYVLTAESKLRAQEIAWKMDSEDGLTAACEAIDRQMSV